MFKNIGKKLMVLAKVFFWVFLITSIVGGTTMIIFYFTQSNNFDFAPWFLPVAIATAVAGPLFAWLSSWGIYSWGELIHNVNQIKNNGAPTNAPVSQETEIMDETVPTNCTTTQKLDQLLSSGLITQEEYDKAISNK